MDDFKCEDRTHNIFSNIRSRRPRFNSSIPIGAKVEISPQGQHGFTLGVKVEMEKIFSVANKC
jgi:hypothetical protein